MKKISILLIVLMAIISGCRSKSPVFIAKDVITVPTKTAQTPEIQINTIFRNDSIVFIDTNQVRIIIKRDTIQKTIQVKAECPETQVIANNQVKEKNFYPFYISVLIILIFTLFLILLFKF